jgi:cardiolipin synthase
VEPEVGGERRSRRLRAGLRRHGLVRRPAPVRALVHEAGGRLRAGNRVEVFHRGRDGLAAMLAAIEGATRRVHLETYILRVDPVGRRFLDALARRAAAGVAVRLLYDAFGSRGIDEGALGRLRTAGADVMAFNPLTRIRPRWAPRRRDHRKILCVDGRVAFTGGLNVGEEYWGRDPEDAGWRDTHVRLEGPAVRDLEAVFLESWFRADGPELAWADLLAAPPPRAGNVRCAVVPDGPTYSRRTMRDLVVSGLRGAERHVGFVSPYFAPGRRVLEALAEASRRGVSVDLVWAGEPTDHPVLRRAAHAFVPRLEACGVRVLEYDGTMLHAKMAIFDASWAIVGTSNLDRQSFEHSYEVNLVLEGDDVVEQLGRSFEADLAASRRLAALELASRSWWERLLDRLAQLVLRIV